MARGMKAFGAHRDSMPAAPSFAESVGTRTSLNELDPERAARRFIDTMKDSAAGIAAAEVSGAVAEFKSLGIDKIPFTGSQMVKFRQYYHKIPVYGSLVTIELDSQNNFVSASASTGEPANVDPVASLSPEEVRQLVRKWAGYKDEPLQKSAQKPARLNFYFDESTNRWRLAYIVEDVLRKKPRHSADPNTAIGLPEYSDFVVDAHTGELISELPRTQTMAEVMIDISADDSLGNRRLVSVVKDDTAGQTRMHDVERNVHTHDFAFRDARVNFDRLPGVYAKTPPEPWDPAAVSAHANSEEVIDFLNAILRRDGLDGFGGKAVSTVNCTWFGATDRVTREWPQAARVPGQMIYGQRMVDGVLRSYAASLEVVAHELLHGLTEHTARLEYKFEPGALNESYSDIFGLIVANRHEPDISQWDWEIGEDLSATGLPMRDLSDPERFNQPAHMDDYRHLPEDADHGGVHTNSGIHNKAAFNILDSNLLVAGHLFTADEVSRIFYMTLVGHLSRTSDFVDSRRGAILSARSMFERDAQRGLKIAAIEKAFDDVGIVNPFPNMA